MPIEEPKFDDTTPIDTPPSFEDTAPIGQEPIKKKSLEGSYSPSFVLPKEGSTSKSENGGLGQFAPIDTTPLPKIVDHRKNIDDAFKLTVDKHKQTKDQFAQIQKVVNTQNEELRKLEEEMSVAAEDTKPFLAEQITKLQEDSKATNETFKALNQQRLDEANRITTLFRGKQVMDKPVDSNIGAGEILGKSFTNAITGMVGGVGSTVEAMGDLPTFYNFQTPVSDEKVTDNIGKAFRDASKAMKLYIPKEAQESVFEGDLTWKKAANTAGQVLGSIGAVVATGGVGGAAGAASTGIALTMNDTYNSAKEHGLTDEEAAEFALPVSLASGMLDMVGAGSIIKNISKKEVVTQLVKNSAEELAGKKITEQAVMGAMDNSIKKMFKDIGAGAVKSGVPELGTEMGQSLIQSGGEN